MEERIIEDLEYPKYIHRKGGIEVWPSKSYHLPGTFLNAFEAERALIRHDNLKEQMKKEKKKAKK